MPKYTDKEIDEVAFVTSQQFQLERREHDSKVIVWLVRIIKILDICVPIVLILLVVFGLFPTGGDFGDGNPVTGDYFFGGL